jgi:hypothetical protein
MLIEADKTYWMSLSEASNVQSLIFDKANFSMEKAKEWASKHGFKTGTDEKENTIRMRQKNPGKFKRFATKPFGNSGIKAVIGYN